MEAQPKVEKEQPIQEEVIEVEPVSDQARVRSPDKEKSPWQTGVHTRSSEEEKPSELEELEEEVPQLQLRTSTRIWLPNP